jgi:hypothetical protein
MSRNALLLRNMAEQAATHPRIEAAIMATLKAELPNLLEHMLSQMCGGDTMRLYVRKPSHAKAERNRRIVADATHMPLALIAKREALTVRQVQYIVKANQKAT